MGRFAKTGHVLDVDADSKDMWISSLFDLNFDGALDLRFFSVSGMYSQFYRFWIYEPTRRKFVENTDLSHLMSPQFDPISKTVTDGGRVSGPMYQDSTYGWIHGKLETLTSRVGILGETPDGGPLPEGKTSWVTKYERVNGVRKKIYDGPYP
jgi:hypothetical protein